MQRKLPPPTTSDSAAEDLWTWESTCLCRQGQCTQGLVQPINRIFTRLHMHNSTSVNQKRLGAKLFLGVNKSLFLQNKSGTWNTHQSAEWVNQLGTSSHERRGGTGKTCLYPVPFTAMSPQRKATSWAREHASP